MVRITATEARNNLYRLIDEAAESHQPIVIMGVRNRAVLVSEEDWSAIQETLFLLSVPHMRTSIREGIVTPVVEQKSAAFCDSILRMNRQSRQRKASALQV
ncbi:MAG: prevent-host-death family protein [Halomonas sp. 54_146]|nr:MAG: prevent-host-death family protein [Halomonas sp. 54_146]HAA45021.1 type II toxin-antitoxin system prevent-host-death family antitoxin [Halomonas sp.]